MCEIKSVNKKNECGCNKFTTEELRELLLNDNCENDPNVAKIINLYDDGRINLDEAITEILVSYLNCDG
ncbi:MAG: hypothetical protein MUO21_00125 [Nitrososphaeraceae archaeon]|nr:hypothetical protein [Nitrososphaeraceae archaeon]